MQVCGGGITLIEAKLKVVCDWSKPQNVKDIRSFLGFANYYRWFIKDFAGVVDPLTDSTRKGVSWQWGLELFLEWVFGTALVL